MKEAKYLPVAFSDHLGLIVRVCLPESFSRILGPKSRSSFRLKPEVIMDNIFKERLEEGMLMWERVRSFQGETMDTLYWWEKMVKQELGKLESKDLRKSIKRGEKSSTFSC